MNSQKFTELYNKQGADETITPFTNEVGFSLVRTYPEDTQFYKDGKRMFIKLAHTGNGLFWSVSMTTPEGREEGSSYIVYEGNDYGKKFTNFYSDGEEPFSFNGEENKIVHKPSGKKYTVNQFVEILVKNHLTDRLSMKRKLNFIANLALKLIFWLSDKHYEKVRVSIDKYHFSRGEQAITEEDKNIEPFFKYFKISRNLIFAILLGILSLTIFYRGIPNSWIDRWWVYGDFSLSNPLVLLIIFTLLFSTEKVSIWLNKSIRQFFAKDDYNKKVNFIEKLHNYQLNDRFDLKIDI